MGYFVYEKSYYDDKLVFCTCCPTVEAFEDYARAIYAPLAQKDVDSGLMPLYSWAEFRAKYRLYVANPQESIESITYTEYDNIAHEWITKKDKF